MYVHSSVGDNGIDCQEYVEVMGYFGIKEPDAERSFDSFGIVSFQVLRVEFIS
jgi:hypothetical protein